MLYGICNIMFFGSVIEEVAKNYIANKEIRNKGYNILEDDRDYLKKGIDFIKDYIYLIVPFYNIYRGTKELTVDYKDFVYRKIEKLKGRNLLTTKKEEKKEEVKPVIKNEVKPKEEIKTKLPPVKRPVICNVDEFDLPEIKIASLEYESSMLADADKYYRKQYYSLKSNNASLDELNKIARKLQQIRKEYDAIQNQMQLIKEKENSLVLKMK